MFIILFFYLCKIFFIFVKSLSKFLGFGYGSTIGGQLLLKFFPNIISIFSKKYDLILISGTNGKSTTTKMIVSMLRQRYNVTTNIEGANIPSGILGALLLGNLSGYAVIEVDEQYLAYIVKIADPKRVVLLNLSRDQLDRSGEVTHIVKKWKSTFDKLDNKAINIIVNVSDPLIMSSVKDCYVPLIAVECIHKWRLDSYLCFFCNRRLNYTDTHYICDCGFKSIHASWYIRDKVIYNIDDKLGNKSYNINLSLPGEFNLSNCMLALATINSLNIDITDNVINAVESINDVSGRYAIFNYKMYKVHLYLAKNPAGFYEILQIPLKDNVILLLNARIPDGKDTSWIWDVDYSALKKYNVFVGGDRKYDIALRLEVLGIRFNMFDDKLPDGDCSIIANYSAFQDIRKQLMKKTELK